jgi:hypothetical protein
VWCMGEVQSIFISLTTRYHKATPEGGTPVTRHSDKNSYENENWDAKGGAMSSDLIPA